jgi:para-aminobenzoate synthetase component 1
MTRDEYLQSVERIKEYIAAGDIFQANFTRRIEARLTGGPADLYRRLRRTNPAPFAAFMDCGEGRAIASSSPERFIALRGRRIETRPIKGTRPRGNTPAEDEANARALEASVKDAAELAMIVDLERNDIGRVADYGSVRVTERAALEAYATVFHLVATVEGTLAPHKDEVDLLKATFPGGSITGAPKVRAMEIIEELEPTARGVYTGAIGYIDFSGDMDLNIAIRTLLWDQGRVTYQIGGGIVADSEPEEEWEETVAKGKALAKTIAGPDGVAP